MNPLEQPESYQLTSTADLAMFMRKKPAVVLEHLKNPEALPLFPGIGHEIKGRLLENMSMQLTRLY